MSAYEVLKSTLRRDCKTWLVTGVAGFIGSNILEALLMLDQNVIGLDNFSTGHAANLEDVERTVDSRQWQRFTFIEGDVRHLTDCHQACTGVDYVLHQAALGSVGRSINDPITSHHSNVDGFLNMLVAARDAGVHSFVYASSSSVYGDHPALPKVEANIGKPLSPYSLTKYINELYADVFKLTYGFNTIGLRYFNVFGPRQNPLGAYAAVIPQWITAMINDQRVYINGDGQTSRDFCYIDNAVQCNLLAAMATDPAAWNQIYNVAVGDRTTLNDLYDMIRDLLAPRYNHLNACKPTYREFRQGDVAHSKADLTKTRQLLGYQPTHTIIQGLDATVQWYNLKKNFTRQ